MIVELLLKNFKLFQDIEIKKLNQISLIGGLNNIGKTSLLEAILMFFDHLNPEAIHRQLAWRGVNILPINPDALWAPIFSNYRMDRPISITVILSKNEKRELRIAYNSEYFRSSIDLVPGNSYKVENHIRVDQASSPTITLELDLLLNGKKEWGAHLFLETNKIRMQAEKPHHSFAKAVFLGSNRKSDPNEDSNRFGELDVIGKQNFVLEILKTIEPRLKSLTSVAVGNMSLIHGDIGIGRKIPVSYMGEGTSKLLSIVLAIATTENGIVLIDEIENGIHYSIMPKIWEGIAKAADEFNCQVIATTHSYECLAALHQGIPKKFHSLMSYIRLEKAASSIIPIEYDFGTLGAALERGWEVR